MEIPRNKNIKDIIQKSSLVALTIAALGIITSFVVSSFNPELGINIAGISTASGTVGLVGLVISSGETFSSR